MNGKATAREMTARQAVAAIKSGQHVLVGSGAAEPLPLVEALAARAEELSDVEVTHLLTLGPAPYVEPRFKDHLRHNALFIGPNVRGAILRGLADYTPCYLYEVPSLIRSGRLPVDVALIQVSPPQDGMCSLGVSVDILKAAIEKAAYVAAQVNPRLPRTAGDSLIAADSIDAFVYEERPLPELPAELPTAAAFWIGKFAAQLVSDGSTLQIGIGAVPNAVLAALGSKKDLGIHSEMISDGVLALVEKGVVNGRRKSLHPGKIVISFCLGSQKLYDAVGKSAMFEFRPVDYVNDPMVIGRNEKMVAVNSALAVDLTGQVAADSIGPRFYSGVGGQVDFVRGAARSPGGRSIIAMPSTAKGGRTSRIMCCLAEGTGVVTTRADVDFVVTEYGIASLKGKTIRERAVALISVAHPKFRQELASEAKALGFLDAGHVISADPNPYPVELEATRHFGNLEVFFRPLKASDERRLKDLFYSQSRETTLMRFGIPLKRLDEKQFQELACIDFRHSMAIGAFLTQNGRERLVAVARYCGEPGGAPPEAAVTVHDDYQGRGLGTFLVNYLCWIAKERGIKAFEVEVTGINARMRHVFKKCFTRLREQDIGPDGYLLKINLADWKGRGNPAAEKEAVYG
ncbi:MAG TPA: GNAT family N-acetyltransferase [Elusimicrobiota bacterium]|nr:GNAT family N-acetyltransferase [Elusimicrobiota bacterium]